MKVVARTDEYTIYARRDERYAVKGADRQWVNGDAKVAILLEHKLIDAPSPKAPPAEAAADEASADEASADEASAEGAEGEGEASEGDESAAEPES